MVDNLYTICYTTSVRKKQYLTNLLYNKCVK